MKHQILFVDDELLILRGLQRALRSMAQDCEMEYVSSGAQAIERLAQKAFDVVVADMGMPHMNGAELFNEVMKHHPQTSRIILSALSDRAMTTKCAYLYLDKPCAPDALKAAIYRAIASGASLNKCPSQKPQIHPAL